MIGPISFDDYGDITGPFRLWRIQKGEVTTVGEMSTADVDALKAKIGTEVATFVDRKLPAKSTTSGTTTKP